MGQIMHDEDEWETVVESTPCRSCGGDMKKCNGMCSGSSGVSQCRRAPEDVARIKAERLRKEEDTILEQAEAIKQRRVAGTEGRG